MPERSMSFLVGDNPFHGISHLSQERARARAEKKDPGNAQHAAQLVKLSLQNGANGFMFSVDETTLSILRFLRESEESKHLDLYALVPYAYEYVRLAAQSGGVSSLAKRLAKQMIFSTSVKAIALNLIGLIRVDPKALLKTYISYEVGRIKSAVKGHARLKSVLIHEIITDMALGFNLDWFFKSYIQHMEGSGVLPGFETRNFAYLAKKFCEWKIDFSKIVIAAPFNRIGFQMNPSRIECEDMLESVSESQLIAMSILAAGYLKPADAIKYLANLKVISGVVAGVSNEHQATETFVLLRQALGSGHFTRSKAFNNSQSS
jgi:uncharacterized protein (DUF486 family)